MRTALTRIAALAAACAAALPAAASADTFNVTTLADSGKGSLRDAVQDANALVGSDRIVFKAELGGAIPLASEITVTDETHFEGRGPRRLTVSGGGGTRIFDIDVTTPGQPVTIFGLKLAGGSAAVGGAIRNADSRLSIDESALSGNRATAGDGGAILHAGGELLTIRTSTLDGNEASGDGGAVAAQGSSAFLGTTTVSDNRAGALGGGLAFAAGAAESLTIEASTVAGNQAGGQGGGIAVDGLAERTLTSALVAANTATAGSTDAVSGVGSPPAAVGFSLIGDPAGFAFASEAPNVIGQAPKLGPLGDYGGPTDTRPLLAGSPAIEAGRSGGPDQRGAGRPFNVRKLPAATGGNGADIGSYERALCGNAVINVIGSDGKDRLSGRNGVDGILGLGGNDVIKGLAGNDGLCGGAGKDVLSGGRGNDILRGQESADRLLGGGGRDKLVGGGGKDQRKQ